MTAKLQKTMRRAQNNREHGRKKAVYLQEQNWKNNEGMLGIF